MNRTDLSLRVRSLTRDLTNGFFREVDIVNYLNEGVDRIGQRIPQLSGMSYLTEPLQEVDLLPRQWQHLLAVYCSARLCTQDERHYQAGVFMNEFETKLDELINKIDGGEIIITDAEGNVVEDTRKNEYVFDNYFANKNGIVKRSKRDPDYETVFGDDE